MLTSLSLSANRVGFLAQRSGANEVSPLVRQYGSVEIRSANKVGDTYGVNNVSADNNQANTGSSRWFHMDRLVAACESDPGYAKQVAEELASAKDGMVLNWADAPSPADAEAWNAWVNQTDDFAKAAEPVNAQRLDLYNNLKAQGKPDIDIVKSLLNFNGSQPAEYQIKTGFMSVDVTA